MVQAMDLQRPSIAAPLFQKGAAAMSRVAPTRSSTVCRSWAEIDLSRLCNKRILPLTGLPCRTADMSGYGGAFVLSAEADALGDREQPENFGRIWDHIRGEAWMQVL